VQYLYYIINGREWINMKKKVKAPTTYDEKYLMEEIRLSKNALDVANSNFDNAVDPDLIDCYIYRVRSEEKRYDFLISKAKALNLAK